MYLKIMYQVHCACSHSSQNSNNTHLQSDELQYRNFLIHHSQWRTAEVTIKQCIASMVPDSVFNQIKTKKSAEGVWGALAAIFQERSLMVAIDLRQKMQSVKCGDSEDVHTHFEKLANTRERLALMGVSLSDTECANTLIGSLPTVYDPTISSITAASKLTKKPIDLRTSLHLLQTNMIDATSSPAPSGKTEIGNCK